jgi:hypothetical protein
VLVELVAAGKETRKSEREKYFGRKPSLLPHSLSLSLSAPKLSDNNVYVYVQYVKFSVESALQFFQRINLRSPEER